MRSPSLSLPLLLSVSLSLFTTIHGVWVGVGVGVGWGGRLRAFDWLAGGGAQGHARARLSTKRPYALGYGCMSRWMCEWVYGVAVSFSDTQIHRYTDTQSHKCAQMAEFSGEYGNTWVFGALVLRYPWIFGHHTHPPRGPWLAYPLRCRGY